MTQDCKICGDPTNVGFNINFKLVPICEPCACQIFIQQANYYTKLPSSKRNILPKTIKAKDKS
jgi:hypothetical protein